jgi:phenylalanyl-tRNA synthetase alpha chain
MQDLKLVETQAINQINELINISQLEELRIIYLGKTGIITSALKSLALMSLEEKKSQGALINLIKENILNKIEQKKLELNKIILSEKLSSEKIDITLPFRELSSGKIHPVTQATEELTAIICDMGFKVVEGPEIEDDYHNFTALNIPENHPARLMHDTFYLKDGALLRTHTSNVQIRALKDSELPVRIMSFGRVYRCDSDMTHTPMFHQLEGLVIDKNIHMGHLKGTIIELLRKFFEIDDLPVRFRASFFPFTEPSAEVDIGCSRDGGELKIGKGSGWLEILGCGMVHPNVLKNLDIDPETYQGFAFGLGVDRMAMLKYGIGDLRTFFEGDTRWSKHYGFSTLDIPNLVGGLSR